MVPFVASLLTTLHLAIVFKKNLFPSAPPGTDASPVPATSSSTYAMSALMSLDRWLNPPSLDTPNSLGVLICLKYL